MRFVLGFCFFMCVSCLGYSIEFRPMSVTFAPDGRGATQSFQVSNPSATEKAAVHLFIGDRAVDAVGNDTFEENDDAFVIYPPQMILQPGETQMARVTWVGNQDIESEHAYRIIAEQLPIDLKERNADGKASIRILMRFVGSIYVTPYDSTAEISLASAFEDTDEGSVLSLSFENSGTRHAHLRDLNIYISSLEEEGEKLHLSPDDLEGISGENILAGNTRTFSIPAPVGLTNDVCEVTFSYSKEG